MLLTEITIFDMAYGIFKEAEMQLQAQLMGNPATRATPLGIIKSMRNPIILEKLGPAAILNQNPIFELGSKR